MAFLQQLKVIIWKNWITRQRSKARCVTDIIWPLFLFLILAWVRTRGLIVKKPNCHFYGKPMPSSGLFPFTQGFICGILNTCEQNAKDTELPYEQINANNFVELLSTLNRLFANSTNTRWDNSGIGLVGRNASRPADNTAQNSTTRGFSMASFLDKKEILARYPNISAQTLDEFFVVQFNLSNFTPDVVSALQSNASAVYCDPTLMAKLIVQDNSSYYAARLCNSSDLKAQSIAQVWRDLFTSPRFNDTYSRFQEMNRTLPVLLPLLRTYANFAINTSSLRVANQVVTDVFSMAAQYDKMMDVAYNLTSVEQAFFSILQFLCGNTSARHTLREYKSSQMFGAKLVDRISDEYIQNSTKNSDDKTSVNSTLTPFCQDFYKLVDKLFFYYKIMIETFFRGKILYYPQTPATDRVMARIKETFQSVNSMTSYLTDNVTSVTQLFSNLREIRRFMDVESGRQALRNEIWRTVGNRSQGYNAALNFFDSFFSDQNLTDSLTFLNDTQTAVQYFAQLLQCIDLDKIMPHNDSATAENDAYLRMSNNTLWALINFTDPGYETLKPTITYSIRMSTALIGDSYIRDRFYTYEPRSRPLYDLKYITFGFAYLQDMLERSIIVEQTGRQVTPGIVLQQFPYPCYIEDQFIKAVSKTFPLFMVLSWVFACSMITKSIVYEKQERLKEMMRVMGLNNLVHWAAWFVDSIVIMVVTAVLLSTLLVYGHVIQHSNPLIIFIFLVSFCVSTIAQSFLYSVLFDQANIAAASGGIIYFLFYLPYPFLSNWLNVLPRFLNNVICLSANVSFGVGAFVIATWEEAGVGVQWSNWRSKLSPSDPFSLYDVIGFLYLDSAIYLLLVWYIEAVFPGQYGVPQPWYFPILRTYWTGAPAQPPPSASPPLLGNNDPSRFEPEPSEHFRGVSIVNLSKKYPNGKLAVNGLNLNFYEDQITSFLGHNGAGKTTTISMLMGMLPASSGTAKVYNHDIRTDMVAIRRSMGVCPQYNALFEKLTVEEHMLFYSRLKQIPEELAQAEITNMLLDLGIPHKRTSLAHTLSGGMQRKLSVAMAFIGGSRTVILDEPTSGVDPYSRRSIWELLIKYKKGRTVILTTHYMDEADLLGDRIAIIAAGKLQCCGSSVFLKSMFAQGYYLSLDIRSAPSKLKTLIEDEAASTQPSTDPVPEVTTLIRSVLPAAKIHKISGSEVTYLLPQDPESMASYVQLFELLSEKRQSLGVDSYGIADTSLEEIFLRIAAEGDPSVVTEEPDLLVQNGNIAMFGPTYGPVNNSYSPVATQDIGETVIRKASSNIYWRQYLALHAKRYQYIKRNKKALCTELIVPALLVCFMLIMTSFLPQPGEPEPRLLSPWMYEHQYMFLKVNPEGGAWARAYEKEILGPVGLGTLCIKDPPPFQQEQLDITCPSKGPELSLSPLTSNISYGSCSCQSGAQLCSSYPTAPEELPVASRDIMFNVSDRNLNQWLVNSFRQYAGKLEMEPLDIAHRTTGSMLGGVELGVPLVLRAMSSANQTDNTDKRTDNVKVWFNNKAWISSISFMNAVNNVILRASLSGNVSREDYGIVAINHPMNLTQKQLALETLKKAGTSILVAVTVLFAMSFVPASFLIFLIEEKISNSKHLQLVSGVNKLVYWVQVYTWDLMCYMFSSTIVVFIFLAFNEEAYISSQNLPGLVALLLCYGFAVIPLMYPCSFLFSVPSTAFVVLGCFNLFVGLITTLTVTVLDNLQDDTLENVNEYLKVVFLIFPHFCLGEGLMKLANTYWTSTFASSYGSSLALINIWAWRMIGKNLTCMLCHGVLYFTLNLSIEYRILSKLFAGRKPKPAPVSVEEDDVRKEKERVEGGEGLEDVVVIRRLYKIYANSKGTKPAVNQVSFGVGRGECFGLLGLNGAGKTTTFKMLTGAIKPTSGNAWVMNHSILNQMDVVRSYVGYCPQFDALNDRLTPREHLEFYSRVRNIPSVMLNSLVNESLNRFALGHYSDRQVHTLSGGNKRKLSTAIALLGNPPLIFLDEPTSGMDPGARRFLWTCIERAVADGRCVILTSHNMEECEALCTKLTIMVNGQFTCLGSATHLKSKYGQGYSLKVRCVEGRSADAQSYLSQHLPMADLVEKHATHLRYRIGGQVSDLAFLFRTLQNACTEASLVVDYSLSQTSLEDVFLKFANAQVDEIKKSKPLLSYMRSCLCCSCCYRSEKRVESTPDTVEV